MSAYVSPLLSLPGAVPAAGADHGVAAHYGDPLREQQQLATAATWVDLSHFPVVRLTGPDSAQLLHSLTSQELAQIQPGASYETMVLSPQGRIEHVAAVTATEAAIYLISESGAELAAFLNRMKFMLRVEVELIPELAVIELNQAWPTDVFPSDPKLQPVAIWRDPWPGLVAGGTTYWLPPTAATEIVATPAKNHPATDAWNRYWVIVGASKLEAVVESLTAAGFAAAGMTAREASRIAALRPRSGTEVDDRTIPHELDWLRTAVHLHKGCYRGQETVAKVHNVGRPPRRLTLLHLDGSEHLLPTPGEQVYLEPSLTAAPIGQITSVALHRELGPIAFGLLKRNTAPTQPLYVPLRDSDAADEGAAAATWISATQEVIVNPDGVSADRPPAPGPTMKGLLLGKGCAADGGDLS